MNKSTRSDSQRSGSQGKNLFPVAKTGYPFIFSFALITIIFALADLYFFSLACLGATFFICSFFRDPARVIPDAFNAVVSPADGKVVAVNLLDNSSYIDGKCIKISIFMSVFNVHVNRIPYNGKVTAIKYFPGKFFSANLDKASSLNEHNAVFIKTDTGKKMCVVQIAGLIARRIICNVHSGDEVVRGHRFGMICFGSRLDVYLPDDFNLNVSVGDKVKAGTFILGNFI